MKTKNIWNEEMQLKTPQNAKGHPLSVHTMTKTLPAKYHQVTVVNKKGKIQG